MTTMRFLVNRLLFGLVCTTIASAGCGNSMSARPGADAAMPDSSSPEPDASLTPDSSGTYSVKFTPAAVSSSTNLTNPLRGQYLWLGTPAYPASATDIDSYQRWNWAELESTHANYTWSLIDNELTKAKARHGRFGMRIMALCQGCGHHVYKGAQSSIPDDLADVVNPLIGAAPGSTENYLIPDWNSDAYFTRLQELITAIAGRYHDDPTFAWVDVFSYGNWGEFHLYPFNQPGGPYDTSAQKPITDANAQRLVAMNAKAFSNKLLVLNSENPAALTAGVASISPLIGIRVDCLGSDGLAGGDDAMKRVPGADNRWKTAPFITEWCQHNLGSSGANLFIQGEQQVRQYHVSMLSSGNFSPPPSTAAETTAFTTANTEAGYRLRATDITVTLDPARPNKIGILANWVNDNVAPTYLGWRVVFGLRGAAKLELPLTVDLRQALPGAALADTETLTASTALASGTYTAYLRVEDVQGISPPMALAMEGRDSSGNYALGSVTVR